MLKCGECTFFKEPSDGTVGACQHPEKIVVSKEKLKRNYEDDCSYGYLDIWAARGAAKLVRISQKPDAPAHTATTGIVGGITQKPISVKMPRRLSPMEGLLMAATAGLIAEWVMKKR